MKGVVFLGNRKLELREFPDPTPGPRDVILAIKASGMCGSDLHTYRAPPNPDGVVTGGIKRAAGVIAGHEPCGVVAAVGTAVTDKEARIGQRVMDHHYDGCGSCKHCRAGWTQMCLEHLLRHIGAVQQRTPDHLTGVGWVVVAIKRLTDNRAHTIGADHDLSLDA